MENITEENNTLELVEKVEKNQKKIIILMVGLIVMIILVSYLVNNYIESDYSNQYNITYTSCYNNKTDCITYELDELRIIKGSCWELKDLPCVVEKDCGTFNGTDFNFTNCSYYAYEPIKKIDIDLNYLEENCECLNKSYANGCNENCPICQCFKDYEVEITWKK